MFVGVRRILCFIKPTSRILGKSVHPAVHQRNRSYITTSNSTFEKIGTWLDKENSLPNQNDDGSQVTSTRDRLIENG